MIDTTQKIYRLLYEYSSRKRRLSRRRGDRDPFVEDVLGVVFALDQGKAFVVPRKDVARTLIAHAIVDVLRRCQCAHETEGEIRTVMIGWSLPTAFSWAACM